MSHLYHKRSLAYALLLICSLLWGISTPIIKNALVSVHPYYFLFFRYLFASFIFIPIFFAFFADNKPKRHTPLWLLIFLALLGTPLTLVPSFIGINLTSSFEAAIIISTSPLLVILGGYLILKEKVTKNERFGIAIALIGTVFLSLSSTFSTSFSLQSFLGAFLIILSNLIWTAFLLLTKHFQIDPIRLSLTSFLISIPFFALLILVSFDTPNFQFLYHYPTLLSILYMSIFSSIIGFLFYVTGQSHIEASEAAVFIYLQPIFALPLSLFWLKESPSLPLLSSLSIIIFGVIISQRTTPQVHT